MSAAPRRGCDVPRSCLATGVTGSDVASGEHTPAALHAATAKVYFVPVARKSNVVAAVVPAGGAGTNAVSPPGDPNTA